MNYKYILSGLVGFAAGGASVYFYMKKQMEESSDAIERERAVTKSKIEDLEKSTNIVTKPDIDSFVNDIPKTNYSSIATEEKPKTKAKKKAKEIIEQESYLEVNDIQEDPVVNERVKILKDEDFFEQTEGMSISAHILTSDYKLMDNDYAIDYELQEKIGIDILKQFYLDEASDELYICVGNLYARIIKYEESYRTLTGIDIDSYR